MLKIISHRGAAGLAPENTLEGIKKAKQYKIDLVEIDIHTTADGKLILIHDDNLYRITGDSRKVRELNFKEISLIPTISGLPIPTLQEAFRAAGTKPLFIDCKGTGWTETLAKILNKYSGPTPVIASPNFQELLQFQKLCPEITTYFSELTKPFEAIQTAKVLKFSGVSLLYSLYNPFFYFLAKRYRLKMAMYTVNRPFLAGFLHLLYPKAVIITDYPDRISRLKRIKNK